MLDSNADLVVYGTVVVTCANNYLHGTSLPRYCMCVSIHETLDKSARLPFPIPNQSEVFGDAIGTNVAWPKQLILLVQEKHQKKKTVLVGIKSTLYSNVPRSLRMLYLYINQNHDNGMNLLVILDHEVFDNDCELHVHLEDIISLYQLELISTNCVVVYIWNLYKKMVKEQKVHKFKFVNPHSIPFFPNQIHDKGGKIEWLNQRASSLADRLTDAASDQLVLVPSNSGFHWFLTVIEPYKDTAYFLDSPIHRLRDEDWKYVVEMTLRMFNSKKGRKGRKLVQWEVIHAPRQPDAKQCGYYVMRFMRQITEECATIESDSMRAIFTKLEYSREEIDEVRSEVAECIQDHIYD